MKVFIFFLACLFISNAAYSGKIYQCKNSKGETTFQSKPCANHSKQKKIYYASTNKSPNKKCNNQCDTNKVTCIGMAGSKNYEEHENCLYQQKICKLACNNPKKMAEINSSGIQLKRITSSKLVLSENGKVFASVTKTEANNWKIKRSDGFFIGMITKKGDIVNRGIGLHVSDMNILMEIHKRISPYLY